MDAQEVTLSFKDWVGTRFQQPKLTSKGILCYENAYDEDSNRTHPDYIFGSMGRKQINVGTIGSPDLRYLYPSNASNLQRLLHLPAIFDEDRLLALQLILQFQILIPHACLSMLALRGSTEARGDGMHRTPVIKSMREELVVEQQVVTIPTFDMAVESVQAVSIRTPTSSELWARQFMGVVPDLRVVETSLVEVVHHGTREMTTEVLVPKMVEHSEPNLDVTQYQRYYEREAYSQQLIGTRTIMEAKRLGLFYDMRVGKTDTARAAVKCAIERGEVDFCIIVCPKTNMYDPWFPTLKAAGFSVAIIDGTEEEDEELIAMRDFRKESYAPTAYIINYERLGARLPMMQRMWDMSRLFVIADETSAIKNPTASRSKSMHALCQYPVPYVTLLNGTPMEQGPQDLYSQLKCLDPYGLKIGASFGDFCNKFLEPTGPGKWRVSKEPVERMEFDLLLATMSIRYIRSEADQFAGKDKNFRYIKIRPTAQMRRQAKNVLDGFVRTLSEKGEEKEQVLADLLIVTYGFLREVSCGYDKYREDEDSDYIRVRHTFDPKLLWVLCHLESCPSDPLVVYCEFTEQEQRLKEELDARGIPWSSTAPKMRVLNRLKFKDTIPADVYAALQVKFPQKPHNVEPHLEHRYRDWTAISAEAVYGTTDVYTPETITYDQELCKYANDVLWRRECTEWFKVYKNATFTASERADEIARFNRGDAHVFICKTSQARGISLNRREARMNRIGSAPTMVSLAPPWSLGTWDQALDRCVDTDDETKKNVCTTIYCLACPGMESQILKALRAKKDVQAELLKDAQREGYSSFVESLVNDMVGSGTDGTEDDFDPEEMFARMACGVPPGSKLKESLIYGKMMEKEGANPEFKSRKAVAAWVEANPEHDQAKACKLLLSMVEV